jgi:predicted CoA-binding protein
MAERRAMTERTNPKAVTRRSAINDQTNPRARPGAAERPATNDQTDRKPAAKASVAKRPAMNRTNPKPAAARAGARAEQADGINGQTNPRPAEPAAPPPARLHYDDAYIKAILQRVRTIAAVGMSANDMRPSYFAMLYLQQKGYRMIPVNPRYAGQQILGETVVASLGDLPTPPDMVQIFRKSEEAPAGVDEAIRAGASVVWLQLGIRSDEAAEKARAAGLDVVMDRCPKIEYGRLFGEIGWAGVNRRVISAKKGQAVQLSHRKGGLARRPAPRS